MRGLKTFVLPVLLGLTVLVLVGLLGSGLVLFREASAVHPVLGWLVAGLIAAALGLLIVYPVIQLLRFLGALVRPAQTEGRAWERFVRAYEACELRALSSSEGRAACAARAVRGPARVFAGHRAIS